MTLLNGLLISEIRLFTFEYNTMNRRKFTAPPLSRLTDQTCNVDRIC